MEQKKQSKILPASAVKEFAIVREIQAKLSVASEKLAAIQKRVTSYETKYNEFTERLQALNAQKIECIEAIAAGTDDTGDLDKIRSNQQSVRAELVDITDLLAEIKKLENVAKKEVDTLSGEIIPAYRESWRRVAATLSDDLKNTVGDRLMDIIAAQRLAGDPGIIDGCSITRVFFPSGFFHTDLMARITALRAENEL